MPTETEPRLREMELLRQAKQGDFSAFQKLIDALQPRVYGLAFRILRQSQDAEDVTQQTFLSLIENIEQFREESSVKTWVMRIACNHALKILRRRKIVGMINMSSLSGSSKSSGESYADMPHPEFIAPWSLPPDVLADQAETQHEIERALGELDEKYRLVFVLRDIEGLSVRETAEALELTESTVKVRLLRARLALRERLTKRFGDADLVMTPDHKHE
ncbi:MAG: sigma-70 family RNA polymerase sigma factor [Pirellulales bacterium]